jgi:hypothetical protein
VSFRSVPSQTREIPDGGRVDRAGSHLQVRLFFTPPYHSIWAIFRAFESHPFSIANAPPHIGCITSSTPQAGVTIFARSVGERSWTGDLWAAAVAGSKAIKKAGQKQHMLALVEGPYGGLMRYQIIQDDNVLLVAGGSGMSFVLGVLDEIVGRRVREGKGGRIDVVWAVKERGEPPVVPSTTFKLTRASTRSCGMVFGAIAGDHRCCSRHVGSSRHSTRLPDLRSFSHSGRRRHLIDFPLFSPERLATCSAPHPAGLRSTDTPYHRSRRRRTRTGSLWKLLPDLSLWRGERRWRMRKRRGRVLRKRSS